MRQSSAQVMLVLLLIRAGGRLARPTDRLRQKLFSIFEIQERGFVNVHDHSVGACRPWQKSNKNPRGTGCRGGKAKGESS